MHHGHACCYNQNHTHPLSKIPYGVLRKRFNDKLETLTKTYGLKVEVMWECAWKRAKQNNPSVVEFMATYTHPARLKPRDNLFGGRTNAYKLYYKAKEGEKIRYLDFTSLYPYCQARKSYPIGHPQIIFKDFEPLKLLRLGQSNGATAARATPPRPTLSL